MLPRLVLIGPHWLVFSYPTDTYAHTHTRKHAHLQKSFDRQIHKPGLSCSFYWACPPAEDRKHCSGIDWLSVCGVIALLILFWKYILFPLLHQETDAVMKGSSVINEYLPLWGWILRGYIIDSHTEWFSGSPYTELSYILHLEWNVHHQTSNSLKCFLLTSWDI